MPQSVAAYLMVNERGRRISHYMYSRALKKLTRHIATTENIHPHRLRHTFATEMIRAGMSVQVLMKILGHTNAAMTMSYVEIAAADLRRDYDKAIQQIGVLKNLKLPDPVTPCASPSNLHDIINILIQRLETLHRDSASTTLGSDLGRFVKRLRRTKNDLHHLLEKAE